MHSLNKAQIIGNLTVDPEIRETPNGAHVATFGVATNRKYKDKSGTLHEEVDFHNVVLWSALADVAERYLKKGNKVYVEGRLQTRTWDDPNGNKRYKTEIVGEELMLLTPKNSAEAPAAEDEWPKEQAEETEKKPAAKKPAAKKYAQPEQNIRIEDIPF